MLVWAEILILLSCVLIGARLGGIAIGAVAGIGLCIFVFVLALPPGGPPPGVLGMIIAVITALAAMQAAGGLDYLVSIAESVMLKHPQYITFIAPVAVYVLVFAAGTPHVIYALLPVIYETSRKAGIRPEKPLSISVIASFQANLASPISAVTIAMLGVLAIHGVSMMKLLMVTIPASFIGTLLGALSVAWRGKDLDDDPEYRRRLASGEVKPVEPTPAMVGEQLSTARRAAGLFLVGLTAVILIGMFPDMRPYYEVVKGPGYIDSDQISMGNAIMIIMIAVAGLIMLLLKASPERTLKGSIMQSGITAIISILGVSWLGSSFFEGNREAIVEVISGAVQSYPSAFAAGMFLLSTMLFSQAATVALIIPVGLALDMPVYQLVAFYPAVGGMFLLPTYGTTLAAVSFDQTGTTSLGTWLLNHSFMRPGMVALITSLIIGAVLSRLLFL